MKIWRLKDLLKRGQSNLPLNNRATMFSLLEGTYEFNLSPASPTLYYT